MRRPFHALALAVFLWVLVLRTHLVLAHSQAPWFEGLGYVCLDLGPACLALAAAALLCCRRGLCWQLVASLWLGLWAFIYGIAYGSFHKTGSLLTWDTLVMVVTNWRDLRMVVGSEVGLLDYLVLGVPLLILALPALGRRWWLDRDSGLRPALWALLGWVGCLGVTSLLIPDPPSHRELSVALLRPLLPFGSFGGDLGNVAGVQNIPCQIEDPDHTDATWKQRPTDAPRPNFLFVLMESVRASATSPYPPGLGTTPFLQQLATEGVVFEAAHAHLPHTGKSLTAMFGGHAPEFRTGPTEMLRLPVTAVPARLQEIGYHTAFFDPSTQFFEHRRLLYEELGFAHVVALEDMDQQRFEEVSYLGLEDRAIIPPLLSWLRQHRGQPFCVGMLNLVTHHDYRVPRGHERVAYPLSSPPPAAAAFQDYLNAVRYLDDMLRDLFLSLRAEGFLNNTVVVLVGDHGEGFGEHGHRQHADNLWAEGMHVPLILWGPRPLLGAPRRVGGLRQLMDIAPTVAELVGVPGTRRRHSPALGRSLMAAKDPERTIFMRSHLPNSLLAMIVGTRKTIYHQRFDRVEHYDLEADPLERRDLAPLLTSSERAHAVGRMLGFQDSLDAWYHEAASRRAASIWQQEVPAVSHPTKLAFGARRGLQLVGIDCPVTELHLNHYLRWRLVFRIDPEALTAVDTAVDVRPMFWRDGVQVPAEDLSFQSFLPLQEVPAGTVLVIPLRHQFRQTDVTAGPVELSLELVRRATGRPLPVTGRASGLLRLRLSR